jgi:hypothetical protein
MHIYIFLDCYDFSEKLLYRPESEFFISKMGVNQGPDQIDTVHGVTFTFMRIITSTGNKIVNINWHCP